MIIRCLLNTLQLLLREISGEIQVSLIVSGISCIGVLYQKPVNGFKGNVILIPVIRVLGQNILLILGIGGYIVWTVGNVSLGSVGPSVSVCFNGSLLYRNHYRKSTDLLEIATGIGKMDNKGLIIRCFYSQSIQIACRGLLIALHHAQKLFRIGRRSGRIGYSLPRIKKILSG